MTINMRMGVNDSIPRPRTRVGPRLHVMIIPGSVMQIIVTKHPLLLNYSHIPPHDEDLNQV